MRSPMAVLLLLFSTGIHRYELAGAMDNLEIGVNGQMKEKAAVGLEHYGHTPDNLPGAA